MMFFIALNHFWKNNIISHVIFQVQCCLSLSTLTFSIEDEGCFSFSPWRCSINFENILLSGKSSNPATAVIKSNWFKSFFCEQTIDSKILIILIISSSSVWCLQQRLVKLTTTNDSENAISVQILANAEISDTNFSRILQQRFPTVASSFGCSKTMLMA